MASVVERPVRVTAEVLVERASELTIACKPADLRMGTQREQYLAESIWKFHAERRLDVRYLSTRRGRFQNERPNIVVLTGQEVMHSPSLVATSTSPMLPQRRGPTSEG
jgi:hypothetical protein